MEQPLSFARLPQVDYEVIRRTEQRIMGAAKSRNTQIAYRSSWKAFSAWCAATENTPLPSHPAVLRDFVSWCIAENYRLETVFLRISAINHFHREAGLPVPTDEGLRTFLSNARRELKESRAGKCALTYDVLRKIAPRFPETTAGIRNRAMILLAFATGWRRSEVVAIRFSDLSFLPEGLALWQNSSKTDQTGRGRLVGIAAGRRAVTCPLRALEAWLSVRGSWDGPLFPRLNCKGELTREAMEGRGNILYEALKGVLEEVGEDPRRYGAHSLRSGMITEAAKHGANEWAIMARTGHRCLQTLQRYVRPTRVFDMNPLRAVL